MRKVVVDTDTGVDDALALMLLAADPDVEILAVLSVFGNTHGDRAADNARYVLDTCGRQDVPVYRGAVAPLVQELRLSAGVHGDDGFGNGNFQALFESIELDQIRRGVINVPAAGPATPATP